VRRPSEVCSCFDWLSRERATASKQDVETTSWAIAAALEVYPAVVVAVVVVIAD